MKISNGIDNRKVLSFCHTLQVLFKGKWKSYFSDWGEADVVFSNKETFFLYLEGESIYRVRGMVKTKDLWLTQIWKSITFFLDENI